MKLILRFIFKYWLNIQNYEYLLLIIDEFKPINSEIQYFRI